MRVEKLDILGWTPSKDANRNKPKRIGDKFLIQKGLVVDRFWQPVVSKAYYIFSWYWNCDMVGAKDPFWLLSIILATVIENLTAGKVAIFFCIACFMADSQSSYK